MKQQTTSPQPAYFPNGHAVHAQTLPSNPPQIPPHNSLGGARGGVFGDLPVAGAVTFVFYAPYKPFVSLVGDFNAWDTRRHPLVSDGQGTWWITLDDPGPTRYGFYVAIDEQSHTWVADPYAREVRWVDEDEVWAFWPGTAAATTRHAPVAGWQTPALRDLVIYELCVRDFGGEWRGNHPHLGQFRNLLPRLDYLVNLGINAIELMPIQAFPGKSSWGYNPVFYFAPAEVYGSPDDLKLLVAECHRRGIAVLLDVAFNHAWGHHPYYKMYPPLFSSAGKPLQDWNPFFHHTPPAVNMWGGVDWDHFVEPTTRYFQDVVRYWLDEYDIDGFRFDWVCGVDYDAWNPARPHFNPFHGISALCWAARQTKPDCILLGEFWQLEGTSREKTAARLVHETEMDACWSGDFHHVLEAVLNEKWQWEKLDIHRALGGFREEGYHTAAQRVIFSCSHDEVRPEHEIKFYAWRHLRPPARMARQEAAMRKGMLGLLAVLGAPGVPMLWAGQEFAEDTPRTIDFLPLTWSKLDLAAPRAHWAVVRRLIHARRQFAALSSDHIEFFPDDFVQDKVMRFRRGEANASAVYVALNFDSQARQVRLPVARGRWRNQVDDRVYEGQGDAITLRLPAWSGALLTPE
ncbi:MAG: alpha-amylase family glycosyl hydrolase [Litorilinea sp.]